MNVLVIEDNPSHLKLARPFHRANQSSHGGPRVVVAHESNPWRYREPEPCRLRFPLPQGEGKREGEGNEDFAVLECAGVSPSPRPSPAGRGSLVRRVAVLEGHAPSWPRIHRRAEARPSTVRINHPMESHAPSWPTNPIPEDIEKSSRVVCDSLSLRERERVRVKATKIFAVLECAGVSPSPRPSPAGRGGSVRLVAGLEGHALSWPCIHGTP